MTAQEMRQGHDTNALVEAYDAEPDIETEELEAAIPTAIDALYTARDAGRHMHEAGAAAAVAVIRALRR